MGVLHEVMRGRADGGADGRPLHDLRRQSEVNVFAPVALIQAVPPRMRVRGRGHIVNGTSMGATATFPGLGAYHGGKFALQGLSDAPAQEVAPFDIRVTAVQPGVYRSDRGGRSLSEPRGEG